ncbi:MAG: tetratricopeptide repeat protein, partial [Thermodesulfobacterium sp.]|nr:tetratricopeptide repeat protein [Thermodesulfobacterium sp.]
NVEIAEKHFSEALKFVSTKEKKSLYYYLGICKAQLSEYNSAIEYLKNSKIFNHNTYFYLGFSFFQKKDYLKAKENLEKSLEFKLPLEEKIPIVLYLGHTYKELKMYESAIELCKEIAEKVFIEQIFNLMGTCYFKLKAYDKAIEYFKRAILLDPFSAIDYANLCLSLKALNRKKEAIYYGKKALELDPELEFVRKALKEMEND